MTRIKEVDWYTIKKSLEKAWTLLDRDGRIELDVSEAKHLINKALRKIP